MIVLSWCLYPVSQLAGIVFPWRDDAKETSAHLRLRWCLHFVLWCSLLAGLWYLNRFAGLERVLRSPWPTFHRTWLPLLGLLVYFLGWLSRGLWLSLERDAASSVWPDLDVTWNEARSALEHAGIDLRATPFFLILGPFSADLQQMLESLGALPVGQRVNAPFHVRANRAAVFVVCHELSQLGRQRAPARASPWTASDWRATTARLGHLCQLVAGDRPLRLPIQGIVLVVAFPAGSTVVVRQAQADLRVIRHTTGLEVPLYVAVSGLNLASSASWFQRFPPLPDLDPAEVHTMFQDGIDWLCLERIAREVQARFRLDGAPEPDGKLTPHLRENIRLYRGLCALQAWRTQLARLLVEGLQNEYSEPGMVAGCYFLSSGDAKAPTCTQALWSDLLAHQKAPTWTAETIAAHAQRRRRTWFGYGAGLLGVCLIMAAGAFLVWR